jgi:hypothetical protein
MKSRAIAALAGLGLAVSVAGAAYSQGIRLDRPVQGGQPSQGGAPSQGAPAGGAGGTITSIVPEQAMRLLQAGGLQKGESLNLDGGTKGFRGELNGFKVVGIFTGCQGTGCSSIAYFAFFQAGDSIDGNYLNAYNRDRRFSRVFLDKEGSLVLSLDTHLSGGVAPAHITQTTSLFGSSLKWLSEFTPE